MNGHCWVSVNQVMVEIKPQYLGWGTKTQSSLPIYASMGQGLVYYFRNTGEIPIEYFLYQVGIGKDVSVNIVSGALQPKEEISAHMRAPSSAEYLLTIEETGWPNNWDRDSIIGGYGELQVVVAPGKKPYSG